MNGSMWVQLEPPLVERLAYQLPLTKALPPTRATEGSPTVEVRFPGGKVVKGMIAGHAEGGHWILLSCL